MAQRVDSIRYPLALDASRGSIALERDYDEHVKQLIIQLLLTSPGERINEPNVGAGLRRAVFGPNSDTTASLVRTLIVQNLEQWLGGVISVDDVTTEAREEALAVKVVYTVLSRGQSDVLNLEVTL
ncbi:GPW/gp25 family protein [Paraliomyxa miuraensis]|uniref:GPW/gp25 family protein n=1 Tax=Paraliomyxa miuraensis TaxID=376150 RepID=UPI00224F16DD|nr:GPW/gp25 family protein [Paraliomyxa miuraensis]MCX4247462.1 GPW/gp25 family protein [Paraliomyxa miuraensis]